MNGAANAVPEKVQRDIPAEKKKGDHEGKNDEARIARRKGERRKGERRKGERRKARGAKARGAKARGARREAQRGRR